MQKFFQHLMGVGLSMYLGVIFNIEAIYVDLTHVASRTEMDERNKTLFSDYANYSDDNILNGIEFSYVNHAYICTSLLPFLFLNLAVFCATIALRRSTKVACCLSNATIISCCSFNISPNSACGFPFRCRSNDWKFMYYPCKELYRYMIL